MNAPPIPSSTHSVRAPSRFDVELGRTMHTTPLFLPSYLNRIFMRVGFFLLTRPFLFFLLLPTDRVSDQVPPSVHG